MAEKIATREAYGMALAALAEKYPDLVCFDADLAGATMTKYFKAACPERFFDMGIAEADMVGVAAGMSLCGFKPFVNTFAMFAAGRAWEQVRNSVAYPHLNVKVVGSHGGLSVGEDGATHQCIEDFAIMRAIPGMLVLCPCDGNEMRLAVEALVNYEGPAYMRLGRLAVETVTDSIPDYRFELGKGATLRDGTDVTIMDDGAGIGLAHHRRGQCPRRSWRGSRRISERELPRARRPPRRQRRVWPQRQGPAGARRLRRQCRRHHRQGQAGAGHKEISRAYKQPPRSIPGAAVSVCQKVCFCSRPLSAGRTTLSARQNVLFLRESLANS